MISLALMHSWAWPEGKLPGERAFCGCILSSWHRPRNYKFGFTVYSSHIKVYAQRGRWSR